MKLDTSAVLRRQTSAVIRPLKTQAELRACVALQRRIWGEDFAEVVPVSILKIAARIGGIVAGAFDKSGTLLGFVFGLAGTERGVPVHWSHMLGVVPEAQNHGIGRNLKEFQRKEVAQLGAKTIYWTFDPLVARNAHLNINVLGVRATEYVENMYGDSSSPLHRGIGTDRLIVAWPVDDAAIAARRREIDIESQHPLNDAIRIEIPADIAALQLSDMPAAQRWRQETRAAFKAALARENGLTIRGFRVDEETGSACYLLAR